MIYTGSPKDGRYGSFWLDGRNVRAHIYAYVLAFGPVPDGMVVDHVRANGCRNTMCIAPDHLEAVSPGENIRRGEHAQRAKTHCPQGHPYDKENTHIYVTKEGWRNRRCRTCWRR